MKYLGDKIRAQRIRLGWTQDELARRMDVRQGTVHKWEAGKATPPIYTLERLAAVLEVTLMYFLDDAPIRERPTTVLKGGSHAED